MSPLKNPFRRSARDNALDREIAFHVEELTRANLARGMTSEEARRRAVLDFGGREQVKQQLREVHLSAIAEALAANLRSAIRFLRKSPSFSLAAILTLALGIGANSAVFSAIDAIILRPLPFPQADQLVQIYQHDSKGRDANVFVAPVRLTDWSRMNSTFQAVSGYYKDDLSELSGALPEKITEALVAPRFLEVLGIEPALGRDFAPDEERFGGTNAVLISQRFWQRRFHGDPAALDAKLHIGSYYYSIVGILPASFQFPDDTVDVWMPSPMDAPYAQSRDSTWFSVIGRLKPGVELKQALADLSTVQLQLGRQFPKPDAELSVDAVPLKQVIVGGVRNSLWLLYGSVSLLLLIACLNIAALLLARTTDREHEIAIRYSLGASRARIVAQLLSEVFVLAFLGSLAGLALAAAAAREFHRLSQTLPRAEEIALNWRIVLYALATAVISSLLCGLIPAIRGSRRGLAGALAQTSRTQVSARNPLQWLLVGAQVTLAVALLVGAGLLLRSFQELGRVSPGFDPGHVLTLQITGSWGETGDMKGLVQRVNRMLDGLRTLPGVEDAATADMLPGTPGRYDVEYKVDGHDNLGHKILADTRVVSAGYFTTARIPVLRGEVCKPDSTTHDLVVNRSFTSTYFNGASPIGHQLVQPGSTQFPINGTIRGVVGDAREEGLNTAPVPTVYFCFSAPNPFPNYLIRTHGDPMQMADAVRRRIHELEPGRSVYAIVSLEQHLNDTFSENRLRTGLITLFAVTAVSLACIGLYGTLSYLGRLRQREVGVRLALGALRGRIVAQFLIQGMRAAAIGCAAGLALGLALTRFLTGMLYGVTAADPATYAAVVLLILLVAALASLVPALRAARVEPVRILREE
jgi:putative ABC transport system permease protein